MYIVQALAYSHFVIALSTQCMSRWGWGGGCMVNTRGGIVHDSSYALVIKKTWRIEALVKKLNDAHDKYRGEAQCMIPPTHC